MNVYTLEKTLIVRQDYYDKREIETYKSNFFDIVFVQYGSGDLLSNENRTSYQSNDILICIPENTYTFKTNEQTKLVFFSFTELLLSKKFFLPNKNHWLQCIEQLKQHPELIEGAIIDNKMDKELCWNNHKSIVEEFYSKKMYYEGIIANSISVILSILIRNVVAHFNGAESESTDTSKLNLILNYIKQNIHDNKYTKISHLASKFNMSQSAISTYFKKNTNISIHQYVTQHKMKLVEYRLRNTEYSIAEIAAHLGYTDESHLTKTFKKHFTVSPKQFRNKILESNV